MNAYNTSSLYWSPFRRSPHNTHAHQSASDYKALHWQFPKNCSCRFCWSPLWEPTGRNHCKWVNRPSICKNKSRASLKKQKKDIQHRKEYNIHNATKTSWLEQSHSDKTPLEVLSGMLITKTSTNSPSRDESTNENNARESRTGMYICEFNRELQSMVVD